MFTKWFKRCLIGGLGLFVVGCLVFGKDVVSYARSSAKSVRSAVKDAVPVEFELRRARDLLEEIIPEMHVNIRMIAHEEVEVAALKTEVAQSEEAITDEHKRIEKLRNALQSDESSYTFSGRDYSRSEVKEDLAWKFDRFKEAQLVLAGKKRLLATRQESLKSARNLLEKTKSRKRLLANKIEGLESQYRLIKASAVGSGIQIDNSKVAQTEKLIAQIKKRLDVAERVLAHESQFVQSIPVDEINEKDLIAQIDEYFGSKANTKAGD